MRVVAYQTIYESVACHTKNKNHRNNISDVGTSVSHLIYIIYCCSSHQNAVLSILAFGIFVSWKATFLKIVPSAGSTVAAWKSRELSPLLVFITVGKRRLS